MSDRLRHRLEVQAMGIEKAFGRYDVPVTVEGGTVHPRSTSYDLNALNAQVSTGWDRLKELKQDLMITLGVPDVHIHHRRGQWRVELMNPKVAAVNLLDLLEALPELPAGVAALGMAEDDRPVLLNLQAEDTYHALIAGGAGAGKTALLRTFALALALTNRQSDVQMLFVEPSLPGPGANHSSNRGLTPLGYLPHVLSATITQLQDIAEALAFVVDGMTHRTRQGTTEPRIMIFVDRLVELLEAGGSPVVGPLRALAQNGPAAGIHLVLSTRSAHSPVLDHVLRANLPVRIVGQVSDEKEARAAAARPGTQAEYLLGQGDFMAIAGGAIVRFQAAFVDDYDLHLCLEKLHRARRPALLARPAKLRPSLAQPVTVDEQQPFRFDGEIVILPLGGPD